jgi:hypothetical protein
MEIPRAIYELGHGEPVRRRRVFDHLGRSADSGPSRSLVAAANTGYGLINGNSRSEYLDLTPLGLKIVSESNERSRREAMHEVLFSNDIFAEFVEHFHDRPLPRDEIATDYLAKTYGFVEADAEAFFEVIKDNLSAHGLLQELSGKPIVMNRTAAVESLGTAQDNRPEPEPRMSAESQEELAERADEEDSGLPRRFRSGTNELVPQFHFNIQIVLPIEAAPETYDNIFRSISTHLLGRDEE